MVTTIKLSKIIYCDDCVHSDTLRFKIYPSKFQIYSTVLLTIVTMLYVRYLELTHPEYLSLGSL